MDSMQRFTETPAYAEKVQGPSMKAALRWLDSWLAAASAIRRPRRPPLQGWPPPRSAARVAPAMPDFQPVAMLPAQAFAPHHLLSHVRPLTYCRAEAKGCEHACMHAWQAISHGTRQGLQHVTMHASKESLNPSPAPAIAPAQPPAAAVPQRPAAPPHTQGSMSR